MSIPEYEQQPYTAPGASTAYDPVTGASTGAGVSPPPPPPYPGYRPGLPHVPNPALAGLLGFIPGVGAMYNGQFAKGIAHIVVFAVFTSLANHVSDIFGLLVAGWVFYMAFEAYQTARARREGLPLPDPFGLNNVGERFGFHGNPDFTNFWHQGNATVASETRVDADGSVYRTRTDAGGYTTTYQVDPAGNVSKTESAAASVGVPYTGPAAPGPAYAPPVPPFGSVPYGSVPYGSQTYGVPPNPPPGWVPPQTGWVPPPPAYGMPPMPPMPPMPRVPRSGLPTGAIWLIGLGVFALLGSLHTFAFLEGEATGGLFLMALGIFMFFKRQNTLRGMYPAGAPEMQYLWVRSMRGAGVIFVVGLLTLFQGLHIVRWESSWPILLIFLGVFILVERTSVNRMSAVPYPTGYAPAPGGEPMAATSSETSIVPHDTRPSNDLGNEEGR